MTISYFSLGNTISLEEKTKAAEKTARNHSLCQKITPFYWEIGDQDKKIAYQEIGSFPQNKIIAIASASKWIFSAYVIEKLKGQLNKEQINLLNFTSGYTSFEFPSCIFRRTVKSCFDARSNSHLTPEHKYKFYYNGGHMQKLAMDLGLEKMTTPALSKEFENFLGKDFQIDFGSPQMAGGIKMSALDYSIFLRKILSKNLKISDFLGSNLICTNPKTCSESLSAPIPETISWHYSLGHWVEDDPNSGDGSFSSPGAFGFYPWIDKSKKFYGLISRHKVSRSAYIESYQCGRLIRKAWFEGKEQ